MNNIITFIVPVKHPDNASDWGLVKSMLIETLQSIAAQDCSGWAAVVVANRGADLPVMPKGVIVEWVDFPPNKNFHQGELDRETFYEVFRLDKGRRVLAGMLRAGAMGHVMIVDADDFVSRKLTSFVATARHKNGWFIQDGYVWSDKGHWLYQYDSDFSRLCGTSHIVRADLYRIPAAFELADDTYIKSMLGSHIFLQEHLAVNDTPLQPLPFIGAVYRVSHHESHSGERGIFSKYLLQRWLLRNPVNFLRRLLRFRFKTTKIARDYFGGI